MAAYSLFTLFNGSSSIGLLPADFSVPAMHFHENTPLVAPVADSMRVNALNPISTIHHSC